MRRLLAMMLAGTVISSAAAEPPAEMNTGTYAEASLEASLEASTEASAETSTEASTETSAEASTESSLQDDTEIIPEGDSDNSTEDASSQASSDESIEASSEASSIEEPEEPVNPDEDKKYYTGYVPVEDPFEIIHNPPKKGLYGSAALPSHYETELLPPLVDQSPYGTCWAFATTALEEINLMKKGYNYDLSELHLSYFTYNTVVDPLGGTQGDYVTTPNARILDKGGNYETALNVQSQWMGAADERTAKYDRDAGIALSTGLQDEIAYEDVAHVQSYFIENIDMDKFRRTGDVSMLDPVKRMVYDYGAAGLSFAAANGFMPVTTATTYSKEHNCFYNPGTASGWHAVVIVGWDDAFPKEYFPTVPPGDGAFLIKNSWTTEEASNRESFSGYFWMSYYENTLQNYFAAVDMEPADNYDNNYQYDGGHREGFLHYPEGANVFKAHAEGGVFGEELKAISFFCTATNADYTVSVYTDVVDTPDSGNLVPEATTTGTTGFAGLTTVVLNNPVSLEPGSKFAVAVKLDGYSLVSEYAYFPDGSSGWACRPGESYSRTGSTWDDLGTRANLKIKAYTCNKSSEDYVAPTGISFKNVANGRLNVRAGEVYKVVAKVIPSAASDQSITWSSSNEDVAKVVNGQIEGVAAGEAVITASLLNGQITGEIQVTVEDSLIGLALTASQVFDFITGENYIKYEAEYVPKNYVPKEDIVWASSDEDVVTINDSGRIEEKMMGKSIITATLEGKTAYTTHTVTPSWDYLDYEVTDEKLVTIKWKAAKDASSYRLIPGNGIIIDVPEDGSSSYELEDDHFVGKEDTSYNLYFAPVYNDGYRYTIFPLALGKNYPVEYELGGGTQNPANPTTYISGRSYSLQKPTPPEGYLFGGWYSDPDFKKYKNSISTSDSGPLKFYASYYKKPPELVVSKSTVSISPNSFATVTASYSPSDGSEKFNWVSDNTGIAEVTAQGNVATITTKGRLGTATVWVSCNGLSRYITVKVQENIRFDENLVYISSLEGNSKKLTLHVADEFSKEKIDWSSSDNSVATVSNGVVTPAADITEKKEITITATIRGTEYSAYCNVTVLPATDTEAPRGYIGDEAVETGENKVYKGSLFKMKSGTNGASIYYALDGRDPLLDPDGDPMDQYTLLYEEALKIEVDTVIKAVAVKKGSKLSSITTFTLEIIEDDWGDIEDASVREAMFGGRSSNVPDSVWYLLRKEDGEYIKYTSSSVTEYSTVYTGNKVSLGENLLVYHGTRKLTEGREYTLSYRNNTVAAEATAAKAPSVTVKGKGNYSAAATFSFTISKRPIDQAKLTSEREVAVMAGKSVKLTSVMPVVSFGGKTLKIGRDYLVSYYEGEGRTGHISDPSKVFLSEPGRTYTAVIIAPENSNFGGEMDESRDIIIKTVDPALAVNVSKLKVTDSAGKSLKFVYTSGQLDLEKIFDNSSEDKNPTGLVKYGKKVLTYGVDYLVEEVPGNDYTKAGKHSFLIKGITKNDPALTYYAGQKTASLEITGIPMSKVKIAGLKTSVEYSGKPITIEDLFNATAKMPESGWNGVTLYYYDPVVRKNVVLSRSFDDGVTGDYTIACRNTVNPGKFTLEFKGENKFTGSVKKTITIKPYSIGSDKEKKLDIAVEDALFSKVGARPKVTVKFILEKNEDDTIKSFITLREGIDYSLTYRNNTVVADKSASKGAPTVVVKGIGNFTGSNATAAFSIVRAPIASAYLYAADIKYNARGKKGYFFSLPKVYQDEKALTIGKGKDLESFNKADVDYTYAAQTILGDEAGTVRIDGETVRPEDVVLPGTVIRISIPSRKLGIGEKSSFMHDASEKETDTIVGYYKVTDPSKSLAKYKVELKDKDKAFFNNGNAISIKESDISVYRVVNGQKEELPVSGYGIKSAKNNRFLGKAVVVIEGKGDYNGTKTLTIKIVARKVYTEQE